MRAARHVDCLGRVLSLLALMHCGAALPADVLVVQCAIDSYRSSYAPRPDVFTLQVDLEAGVIVTFYGTVPLKMTRRELRGVGVVSDGWQASVVINRKTGRFESGTDRINGRKYSYVEMKGTCILPLEIQGAGYKSPSGS